MFNWSRRPMTLIVVSPATEEMSSLKIPHECNSELVGKSWVWDVWTPTCNRMHGYLLIISAYTIHCTKVEQNPVKKQFKVSVVCHSLGQCWMQHFCNLEGCWWTKGGGESSCYWKSLLQLTLYWNLREKLHSLLTWKRIHVPGIWVYLVRNMHQLPYIQSCQNINLIEIDFVRIFKEDFLLKTTRKTFLSLVRSFSKEAAANMAWPFNAESPWPLDSLLIFFMCDYLFN